MRNRQYLGCLRVRDGVLTLEQLYFADEVDDPKKIASDGAKVAKRELDMALSLIKSLSGDWKPEKYRDTYHDALMKVIKEKQKGHEIRPVAEPEEPEETPDLLEALRLSVERANRSGAKGRARRPARSPSRAKPRTTGRRSR
jgi:DNA end-binding protein Ku